MGLALRSDTFLKGIKDIFKFLVRALAIHLNIALVALHRIYRRNIVILVFKTKILFEILLRLELEIGVLSRFCMLNLAVLIQIFLGGLLSIVENLGVSCFLVLSCGGLGLSSISVG